MPALTNVLYEEDILKYLKFYKKINSFQKHFKNAWNSASAKW